MKLLWVALFWFASIFTDQSGHPGTEALERVTTTRVWPGWT